MLPIAFAPSSWRNQTLKISKALSSAHLTQYFQDEYISVGSRYFSQSGKVVGQWYGRLAEVLELRGEVEETAFMRMAEGQHPETGQQLIKHREFQGADGQIVPHRAGHDFTFGASKSVSAAAIVGGDFRIIDAHNAAVRKALDYIERYCQARMRDGQPVTTERMAFALFLHDTARPVNGRPDPHLHTHAVGFNMTLDGGKFRSIDPREMFRIQSFASAVYHSEMAVRLKGLGYELQQGRNFSVEIKGFSPEYLRAISSRTDEIERYKKEHGLYGAEADEIVNRKLRNAKELWKPETLLAEYRKQAAEMGEAPERVAGRAKQHEKAIRIDQDQQN